MRCAWLVRCAFIVAGALPVATSRAAPILVDLDADLSKALAEFDQAQHLQADQPDRARQLFRSAAQRFNSVIASGVVNGKLEYNLANCYLQAGDVGHAILHYRRAARLIPGNEMLADNLSEARSRCLTSIQPTRRSVFIRSLLFWHFQTSLGGRARVALVCYVAVWVLLTVRNFLPRRAITVAAIAGAVIVIAAAASAGVTHWTDRNAPSGVVTAMDVVVYKGPGTSYQRQFEQPLQPGVEFVRRQRRGDWWKIELADGKPGWIDAAQAELVPHDFGPESTF